MYNRYEGNSGRVQRMEDRPQRGRDEKRPQERPAPPGRTQSAPRQSRAPGAGGIMEQLSGIIPRALGELETEDLILLLILYLMYRESGDREILIIIGAMFLLQ